MNSLWQWTFGGLALALGGVLLVAPSTRAADIGYIEDFSLSKDRPDALKLLVPGSEDFYYYSALHALNTEQFEKVEALAKAWYDRYKQTPRLTEIQTRLALLTFEKDPKKTIAYLKDKLGTNFSHQKETVNPTADLATALDPKKIARDTLRTEALRQGNLSKFEDSSLDWLIGDLPAGYRREWLQRLQRPDVANLPALIHADLQAQYPPSFGDYTIHKQLTLAQLDELLKLNPGLLNTSGFVAAYLAKLQPGADDDWQRDRKLTLAYLQRLQAFVARLAPVHNALKAHVLYHRLAFDRAEGKYDRELFLEYLKLPRNQPYMSRRLLDGKPAQETPATLTVDFAPLTLLPIVNADEPLIRSVLAHFFEDDTTTKGFEDYISDVYLRHLFAEVKLGLGLGDAERWAAQLPPETLEAIKSRVDIDFAFTNKTQFAPGDPIRLDLFVKNAPNLLVKIYEINTTNYYRLNKKEIDTDINLDGLVANAEFTVAGNADPLRRTAVAINLPDAARNVLVPEENKPGVFVIDFIGNGKSSRALVRRGQLRTLATGGGAGHKLRVLDESNKLVKDAVVWLGGVEYKPDADGTIFLPYSTSPGRRPIVVTRGDFSSLDVLDHKAEQYALTAGLHIDRESLLTQSLSQLILRPGLALNGQPVSVKLLEEARLRITSTDHDGVSSSIDIPNVRLFEDRETTQEFRVPPRLASVNVVLTAKVKSLSTGSDVEVSASQTFKVNAIAKTDKIEDLHFAKFGSDYVLEVLGRTGEAKAERAVQLSLKHRDFKDPVTATLKSNAKGRVLLGTLDGISTVTATGPEGTSHTWTLSTDRHTYRSLIHARLGDTVVVPYLDSANPVRRDDVALFAVRGNDIRADKFEAISVNAGALELKGLSAGDYDLWLKTRGERIRIRVVDGKIEAGHVLGALRHLEQPLLPTLRIESIVAEPADIVVQLREVSKFARVHVFATRYQPAFDAYNQLARVRDREPSGLYPAHPDSVYLTGRTIGDEYRYVLERKNKKKFPGNMLERPTLLLNPWAIRTTETGEQLAKAGDDFGGIGNIPAPAPLPPAKRDDKPTGVVGTDLDSPHDLDFLAEATSIGLNLVPDEKGIVRIARKNLGSHAMVHVVAADPLSTTIRSLTLPESPATFADLRMRNGLDPAKHFAQQKQTTVLEPGVPFTIADAASSRFEVYDSLGKVYSLYATLSKDAKLAEFAFLLRWPKLKIEEQRSLYSKYACHELNFFLSKKDPAFFDAVVKPYLANKKDKTFLDRALLNLEIKSFLDSWNYARLNVPERVLLSRTIDGEPAKTSRHFADLLKLLPPNPDRDLLQFEAALATSLMDAEKKAGGKPGEGGAPTPTGGFGGGGGGRGSGGFPGSGAPAPGLPGGGPGGPKPSDEKAKGDGKFDGTKDRDGNGNGKEDAASKSEDKSYDALKKSEAKSEKEYFYEEARKKAQIRQLYRKLDPTQEWAENNYYKLRIAEQIADLVPVNPFWADWAKHDGKSPFLSKHFPASTKNFTEMMFALAVLDLPFEAAKHETTFDKGAMTFKPGSRAIAFHEEVKPAPALGGQLPILVSQNFYRQGDRFREEAGEKLDKFVIEEFVAGIAYGCQVVVTNPTSSRQKLSVLIQLPLGAMPLSGMKYTKSQLVDLEPYRTQTIDYLFYFPTPGKFAQFPVHVAKNEQFAMAAKPMEFNVVAKPSKIDTTTWDHVSQFGTSDEVLAFLDRENVRSLNLEKIAFRLKDRAFFETVVKLLQARHLYHGTTYGYGLFHGDIAATRQYLLHADALVNECGGPIDSPLLAIDPVARHTYEHLEYKPLVNARTHALGQRRQIVNEAVHAQYHRLLKLLSYRKELNDDDLLAVTYYLLLQDRVDEAGQTFARVGKDRVATKMQYDYCAAYLDFFTDDPKKARAIAQPYADHPVDRWRNTFAAILSQLDEVEGKPGAVNDKDNRDQKLGQLAATEPTFEVALDGKTLNLTHQNLDAVTVNFYPMDVELLFSTNPFVQQSGGAFQSIKPNKSAEWKLEKAAKKSPLSIPAEFANKNVLIEVTGGGKSRTVAYYATAMTVTVIENYGQLKAANTADGKALGKVYVKVYAKLADGSVKFHKDGYTDLRGKFDYASVNTPERQAIQSFAVLVLSEDKGALIREVAPPQK